MYLIWSTALLGMVIGNHVTAITITHTHAQAEDLDYLNTCTRETLQLCMHVFDLNRRLCTRKCIEYKLCPASAFK